MPPYRAATPLILTALLAATGCGGDDPDESREDAGGGSRTAALTVTAAWSPALPNAHGTGDVSTADGTSVQLAVGGLAPDTEYTAHVHDGTCDATPPGGGHWLADLDGEDATGNIIELSFTSGGNGTGDATVSSGLALDDRALSIVVHAPDADTEAAGLDDDRVLCGDLEPA